MRPSLDYTCANRVYRLSIISTLIGSSYISCAARPSNMLQLYKGSVDYILAEWQLLGQDHATLEAATCVWGGEGGAMFCSAQRSVFQTTLPPPIPQPRPSIVFTTCWCQLDRSLMGALQSHGPRLHGTRPCTVTWHAHRYTYNHICVYIYTNVYTYTYADDTIYVYTYIYIYIYMNMHILIYIYMSDIPT